jgi:hypothetical protein
MLDGVGTTLERLEGLAAGPDDRYLVCIISDGMENASRRFTYGEIGRTIRRLQGTIRWTFTYIGANQDLSRVTEELGVPRGNVREYQADAAGTSESWERHRAASVRFMSSTREPARPTEDFYQESHDEQ